jgi:hypothetical protein
LVQPDVVDIVRNNQLVGPAVVVEVGEVAVGEYVSSELKVGLHMAQISVNPAQAAD